MKLQWLMAVAAITVAAAQEDASSLAWSGVGEAAGNSGRIGRFHPATLGWERGTTGMVSVVPSMFGMAALRQAGVGLRFADDGRGALLSGGLLKAGTSQRQYARVSFGLQVTDALSLGAAGGAAQWSFPRYDPVTEWEGSVGFQLRSPMATTGVLVTAFAQEGRPISGGHLRIAVGVSMVVVDGVTLVAEAVESGTMELRAGASVAVVEGLTMILSWSDLSGSVGGGVEASVGSWQFLAGSRWHPLLGWTHGGDLRFLWR